MQDTRLENYLWLYLINI